MSRALLQQLTKAPQAPAPSPALAGRPAGLTPAQLQSTTNVIACIVAGVFMICLMAAVGRALYVHLRRFGHQAAGEAAAAGAGTAGEHAVEQNLKRITPYIVVQPGAEIMFGRKESAAGEEASDKASGAVSVTADAIVPAGEEKQRKSYAGTRLYTVDIFAMPDVD